MIHGVENKIDTVNYFTPFVERIQKFLTLEQRGNIRFHAVDYSTILDARENVIYSWMKGDHWQKLRWVGAKLICDVLAYAYPKRPTQAGDVIYDITKLLADKFVEVTDAYPDSEKWIIGHSLGCIVGFGFSWDLKIDGLIAMGNPHDYFSIRYKNFGEDNKELANFINFHDPWDPISTRVSKNPNFKRVTDILVSNWNPLLKLPMHAHTAYWANNKIAGHIASILTKPVFREGTSRWG
jgi:hypothetical protein